MTKTVVIVGGSFAGIKAAWDLRHRLDVEHRILIISDKPRGLTNDRGFVPVDWNTMRADESVHRNIYSVGDCIGNPGPKQGHLALMQATIAAEHIAWRINQKGSVRAYLPEFRCVMDQGGGNGLYLYSQYMSDGDVLKIELGSKPYESKIRFEQIFLEKRGDIGELNSQLSLSGEFLDR